ncbi:NIF3-like protein 1 isoform X2 [Adelges cooleyi]|uniref:NIF3-like protein 1 isoform X2 n=1 Tax=Adelges cooleyi TaxID=133065 RepID=UPI0021800BC4|nr:NIF3-like protein 1 isoform X2 [Adelges cooleyi]
MFLNRLVRFIEFSSNCHTSVKGFIGPLLPKRYTEFIGSILVKRYSTSCNKMFELKNIVSKLDELAPLSLAGSWDNVGLLIEPAVTKPVENVFFTNDLTEDVLEEATIANANLIISYHPPVFSPLKRITNDTWKGRIVSGCLAKGIAVYSPHTSWDSVDCGLTDWLISIFDGTVTPIQPMTEKLKFNFVVTIPKTIPKNNETTHSAVKYDRTYFEQKYHSQYNTNFVISNDSADQIQILCNTKFLSELMIIQSTERVALHVNKNEPFPSSTKGNGRYCQFKSPLTIGKAVDMLKQHLGVNNLMLALPKGMTLESTINSAAAVAGSGASLLHGVKADLYITGEMSHHDVLDAIHNNVAVILSNHSNSERGYLKVFAKKFHTHFPNLQITISKADKDPLLFV